jgi:carbon storage regulator
MLVISRKAGQWIEIGSDIKVHIFGMTGKQVKIGIDAPQDVTILRNELVESRRDNDE